MARPASHFVEAFGETKSVSEWAKDPRCVVNRSTLSQRLIQRTWENPEMAITMEPRGYVREMKAIERECEGCGVFYRSHARNNRYCNSKCQTKTITDIRRTQIAQIKVKSGCVDCGYRTHHWALHFDHLDSTTKEFQIADIKRPWDIILAEIEKCEVVCSNCHAIRTGRRAEWTDYMDKVGG